jgi:hypothetical protein
MGYAELDNLLDEVYWGQDRLTSDVIRRAAAEAELPAYSMTLLDRLPEGEYSQDEAAEALRQVPRLVGEGDADPLADA